MKVLISPVFDGNQYQQQLISHLGNEGIKVVSDRSTHPPARLIWEIIQNVPDVIHIHWTHPYFLFGTENWPYRIPGARLIAVFFALLFVTQIKLIGQLSIRIVWTVHNLCNHENRYVNIDRWVGIQLAKEADVLQVWDESTRAEVADYLEVPTSKVEIVPHGGYSDLFDTVKLPTQVQARETLDISEFTRVLLCFGLIRPYKQVPTLIETFSELGYDNACLLVAGNPMQDGLEKRVRDVGDSDPNVRLDLRYIPESEIPTLFAAADFAVLPYRKVFNSGAAVLAMSQSTPVVAPDMGSLTAVLPSGNILYNQLECGLRRAIRTDEAEIISVGQKNREAIESEHDWRKISQQIIELYVEN